MSRIFSIREPWSIIKGRWKEAPAQVKTLERAKRTAERPTEARKFLVDVEKPPSSTILWPAVKDLREFDSIFRAWDFVSIDIESAGHFITIVGLGLFDWERVGPKLVLPFKTEGGLDYWNEWSDHLEATELLYGWLAEPSVGKWFHNGVTFDVPMLEAIGFEVAGELWDTMVMAHYTYPELPKGLQYLSTMYLGFPHWKSLLDETEDLEGKS